MATTIFVRGGDFTETDRVMSDRVRALVVEDEAPARRRLLELLRRVEWIECLGAAEDGERAITLIDTLRPDLVFLDIQLPGVSGLEVLRRVRHHPAVIFTTAYDRYAVSAFELEADDDYVRVFTRERSYLVYLTLNDFERHLDAARFLRIHRGHMVNIDFVHQLVPLEGGRMQVELRDGTKIAASRARTRDLRNRIL